MGLIDCMARRMTTVGLAVLVVLPFIVITISAQSHPEASDRVRCFRRINRNGKCRGEILNNRAENAGTFYNCCRPDGQLKGLAYRLAVDGNQQCRKCPSPRNGDWSSWTPWTLCSATCGSSGFQRRERRCNSPEPLLNGLLCRKSSSRQRGMKEQETRACARVACPVHGGWTAWSDFSECSVTCGTGNETTMRKCENPRPANGGRPCQGKAVNVRTCNRPVCAQVLNEGDEKWHPWSEFSSCSKQCGIGIKTRSRTCKLNQLDGVECIGALKEEHYCQLRPCAEGQISCGTNRGGSGSGSGEGSGDGSSNQDPTGLSDDEDVDISFVQCCKKRKLTYNNKGHCCPEGSSNSGDGSGSGSGSGAGDDEDEQTHSSSCLPIAEYQHSRQRRDAVPAPVVKQHHKERHVTIRRTLDEDHNDEDYADDDLVFVDTKK